MPRSSTPPSPAAPDAGADGAGASHANTPTTTPTPTPATAKRPTYASQSLPLPQSKPTSASHSALPAASQSTQSTQSSLQSSWLLRLFESDFFDARLALSYLHKYPDSVGIQHYICNALASFPESDIEFLLPQMCHMLITRPHHSVALEGFITDMCRASQHMAILTLWYLEAYLKEMQMRNIQTASSRLCQRLYLTCQSIVFDDAPVHRHHRPHASPSDTHDHQYQQQPAQDPRQTIAHGLPSGRQIQPSRTSADSTSAASQASNSSSSNQQQNGTDAGPQQKGGLSRFKFWQRFPGFTRSYNHIPPSVVGVGVVMGAFGTPQLFGSSAKMILSQTCHPRVIDGPGHDIDADSLGLAGPAAALDADDDGRDDEADVNGTDAQTVDVDSATRSRLAQRRSLRILSGAQQNGKPRGHGRSASAVEPTAMDAFFPNLQTSLITNLKLIARIPTSSPSLEELSKGSAFSFSNFVRKASTATGILSVNTGLAAANGEAGGSHSAVPFASHTASPVEIAAQLPPSRRSFDSATQNRRLSAVSTDTTSTIMALKEQSHLLTSHYFHSEMQFIMTLVDVSDRLRFVPKSARQSMLVAELTLLNHNLPADVCIPFWCPADAKNPQHHRVVRISPNDAVVLNSADRVPFLIMVEVVQTDHRVMTRRVAKELTETEDEHGQNAHGRNSRSSMDSQLSGDHPHSPNFSSAEYYKEVLNRRQSFSMATKQPLTLQPPKTLAPGHIATPGDAAASPAPQPVSPETHSDMQPVLAVPEDTLSAPASAPVEKSADSVVPQTDSASSPTQIQSAPLASPTRTHPVVVSNDEFSERMRTAAVMLAQLYQQQQREASALSAPPAPSSAPLHSAAPIQAAHARLSEYGTSSTSSSGSSTPRSSHDRSRASSAAPGSPNVHTDRRAQVKMRTEFEDIRNRVIKEMMALEQQRMEALSQQLGSGVDVVSGTQDILPEQQESRLRADSLKKDAEDPSASVFREPWHVKRERIRASSPYGQSPKWDLISVIVKSGADLRQEQLALQLISEMQRVWTEAAVPVWVYPFRMLITSEQSGLIETIRDAISVHSIKKEGYARQLNQSGIAYTLYDYFIKEFGQPGCDNFQRAQDNFMRSLAGYSIICYLLQIKDRHNGNILLDLEGHCAHIDFGFMLSNSPGSVGFELAPFKLPQEYIDILGGMRSAKFAEFRALLKESFLALRKSSDSILGLVEIMEKDSTLPCFTGITPKPSGIVAPPNSLAMTMTASNSSLSGSASNPSLSSSAGSASLATGAAQRPAGPTKTPVTDALRDRFGLAMTETQVSDFIDRLIESSCNNMFTKLYDSFQYYANGIL
ncbi:hypothetical protein BC831DRAFT_476559 [Entophlyctis helioformis]|nr:hypothetical protein BC831DRAFT_476559 [Entophlyctis helioformis]